MPPVLGLGREGNLTRAMRRLLLVFLGALFPLLALGLDEAGLSQACGVCGRGCTGSRRVLFIGAFTDDDGVVNDRSRDPADNGLDPGYDKNVAACSARLSGPDAVLLTVTRAYPSYSCRFWVRVRNGGTGSIRCRAPAIDAPPGLTVRAQANAGCSILQRNQTADYEFLVHLEQSADQSAEYEFEIDLGFGSTACSPGCR